MKRLYQIGQLLLTIESEEDIRTIDKMEMFRIDIKDKKEDAGIIVSYVHGGIDISGVLIEKGYGYKIYKTESGYIYSYNVGTTMNEYPAYLYMNSKKNKLLLPEEHREELQNGFPLSMMLGIDQLFLQHNHTVLHASVIDYQGSGIIFTGASGKGKSTQAAMWEKYMGAEIINGDRAVLHVGNGITVYGSPYAGSSGIIRNVGVPVKAIILLEQANDNRIEHLNRKNAFRLLYGRFLLLKWDEKLCNLGLDMIQKILETVPVYRLTCRPDKDAVELVKKTLFGNADIA